MSNISSNLILEKITFKYPGSDRIILENLNLHIEEGSSIVVLGPNGSGKSTLLKILAGLIFPQSGSYEAFGKKITNKELNEKNLGIYFRKEVGYLFQNSDVQLFNSTVEDELAFGPTQLKFSEEFICEQSKALMNEFGIEHLANRPPFQLSGGEKKKVAFASTLALDPSVLILDEPTAGLDPKSTFLLVDKIQKLNEKGKTIITACHDLHLVADIATRVIVLNEQSQLIADNDPLTILCDNKLLESANIIYPRHHKHFIHTNTQK